MNIYLISRPEDAGWNEYKSAVVYANSESEAKTIHPAGDIFTSEMNPLDNPFSDWYKNVWESTPETVIVEYVGSNKKIKDPYVILSSFRAG